MSFAFYSPEVCLSWCHVSTATVSISRRPSNSCKGLSYPDSLVSLSVINVFIFLWLAECDQKASPLLNSSENECTSLDYVCEWKKNLRAVR